jgi:hypothetical protein
VQGGEKHGDGYIIYGLGNFFLPYNTFANGKLSFPGFARTELVFELDANTGKATCHWFEYENNNDDHKLKHLASEDFENSALLKKYTPFAGMGETEFLAYYKANRRKKFLVPVYKDYRSVFKNSIYTKFLKNRGRFARALARLKIRKWQN